MDITAIGSRLTSPEGFRPFVGGGLGKTGRAKKSYQVWSDAANHGVWAAQVLTDSQMAVPGHEDFFYSLIAIWDPAADKPDLVRVREATGSLDANQIFHHRHARLYQLVPAPEAPRDDSAFRLMGRTWVLVVGNYGKPDPTVAGVQGAIVVLNSTETDVSALLI